MCIDFTSFYDFCIEFWNCCDNMVLLVIIKLFKKLSFSNGKYGTIVDLLRFNKNTNMNMLDRTSFFCYNMALFTDYFMIIFIMKVHLKQNTLSQDYMDMHCTFTQDKTNKNYFVNLIFLLVKLLLSLVYKINLISCDNSGSEFLKPRIQIKVTT